MFVGGGKDCWRSELDRLLMLDKESCWLVFLLIERGEGEGECRCVEDEEEVSDMMG